MTLPFNLPDIIFLLALALLLLGYIRHMLRPGDSLASMERWIQSVYPFGLLVLVATAWLSAYLGWGGFLGLERWWASLVSGVIFLASWLALRRIEPWWQSHPERTGWVIAVAQPVARLLNRILRLDWLYLLFSWLYRLGQRLIQILTLVFEGDGGLLWIFVLLALLISLLRVGPVGAP